MIKKFKSFDNNILKAKSEIETITHIISDDGYEVTILKFEESDGRDFLAVNINISLLSAGIKYRYAQIEHLFRGEQLEEFVDRLKDICDNLGLVIYKICDEDKLAHLTLKISQS